MKKLMLASALLASAGAASAQSSLTVFGVIDATLAYGTGSIATRTQLANSGYHSTRLGFRGVEDLGGGMSASFWLEAGINNDNGTGAATNTNNRASGQPSPGTVPAGAQGLTFNRRSTVSVAGPWGELRLGRDYVPQFWSLTLFDPFNTVGAGGNQMMSSIITGVTAARASNSIGYLLPSGLGGFYGQAMYHLGENASGAGTSSDGNGVGVRVGYAGGPLNIALASGRTQYAAGEVRQSNLAGEWNLGVAKLQGQISRDSNGAVDAEGALLGVLVPMGAGEWRAAYSTYSTDAAGNPKSKKLALGYVHNLSKRTALYATWARVKNSGGAAAAINGAATAANASSTGYDLGIRHFF